MMLIIYVIALLLLLLLLAALLRRLPLKFGIMFWATAPLLLLPLWLQHGDSWSWFLWTKSYSVFIPCLLLFILRARKLLSDKWVGWGWLCLYAINILEAVAQDLSQANYLNAAVGIALILWMPSRRAVQIEHDQPARNLSFELPLSWIIAYSVWNFTFLYGNWDGFIAVQQVAVLSAPLIIALRYGWRYWSQARAITLGLFLMIYDSFYPWFTTEFVSPDWQYPYVALILSAAAGIILLWPTIQRRLETPAALQQAELN